jgi:hypothetical protein
VSDDDVMNRTANGLDMQALDTVINEIRRDAANAVVQFRVMSAWRGQTRSETVIDSYSLGGQRIARTFRFAADEPTEPGAHRQSSRSRKLRPLA